MIKKITASLAGITLLSLSATAFASPSFLGNWTTFDDETKQAKSLVTIIQTSDGTLSGKVTRILLEPYRAMVCQDCPGKKNGQKIEGIEFLWGMEKITPTKYDHGEILDPQTGKTYSASMTLLDNGNKLEVRGYIGMAFLGRSQVWERASQ